MIELRMSSNSKSAMADIEAIIEGIQDKATLRAINRTVDAIATQANREVRKVYKINAAVVAKTISKQKAFMKQAVMRGAVTFKGRGLNLVDFTARQTKKGVSVQVTVAGGRKTIPGTFIATNTANGFRGVFRRVGVSRYPIKNLRSISVPQAVRNEAVDAAIRKVADSTFKKTFDQQMAFLRRR